MTRPWLPAIPWVLAVAGLAIPMLGSNFAGWPFVLGWLIVLVAIWWVRPLGGVDRFTRTAIGLAAIVMLVVLAFEGGLFLIPATVAWLGISLATPVDHSSARRVDDHSTRPTRE